MPAKILDGKAIAASVRAEWKLRADKLAASGHPAGLAVIIVGDHAASQIYVRSKIRSCADLGMYSEMHELPADTSEAALRALIEILNRKREIHGILVQLPLPAGMDTRRVLDTINPAKDVDGFTLQNAGALFSGLSPLPPCTPAGILQILAHAGVNLRGSHAVMVGASNVVGKPMAMVLLAEGATVTLCNSKTRDLAAITRQADVLVVAVGKPGVVTGDMIKPGAVVIDVGINRLDDGKLAGDVDFASAVNVAGAITPVPGGVGPMTITMLLVNTIRAAEHLHATEEKITAPKSAHAVLVKEKA